MRQPLVEQAVLSLEMCTEKPESTHSRNSWRGNSVIVVTDTLQGFLSLLRFQDPELRGMCTVVKSTCPRLELTWVWISVLLLIGSHKLFLIFLSFSFLICDVEEVALTLLDYCKASLQGEYLAQCVAQRRGSADASWVLMVQTRLSCCQTLLIPSAH